MIFRTVFQSQQENFQFRRVSLKNFKEFFLQHHFFDLSGCFQRLNQRRVFTYFQFFLLHVSIKIIVQVDIESFRAEFHASIFNSFFQGAYPCAVTDFFSGQLIPKFFSCWVSVRIFRIQLTEFDFIFCHHVDYLQLVLLFVHIFLI
ncbi:MAG: hypothetical protein ACD_67C00118G0003 [uncultured bacterium]|nr:MAG: hypothetical protein ACD_67C00118G0003 [uncultured bacterium]